jgi:hypothetical protein
MNKNANFSRPYSAIGVVAALLVTTSVLMYSPLFAAAQQPPVTMTESANVSNTSNTTTATPNATQVEFALYIEQMRGHLDQAVINKQSGNNTLAQAHVLHPIEEILSKIGGTLAAKNSTLNQTLSANLNSLSSNVTTFTAPQFVEQTNSVDNTLNDTVKAVIPVEAMKDVAFNASVVARLLDTSEQEYAEGVGNGTVKSIVEYQDARAFISRAESIFHAASSHGLIDQSKKDKVEEVNQLFLTLNNAVNNRTSLEVVEQVADKITQKLSEITGLPADSLIGKASAAGTANQDSAATINNIKSLLSQLVSAYKVQNYTGAGNIAVEAYLDNFESLEGPIAEHDPQLMSQTELMLREQLRQQIQNRVPVEQIQQLVGEINTNLDKAASLLQQQE